MVLLAYLLVVVHLLLAAWAIGGWLELLLPSVPWKPYTNPLFPRWVLVLHWGSVLFASAVFLFGWWTQWPATPRWMIVGYGLMATVCLIETLGYMTSDTKYLAMAAEFAAYIAILWLLHHRPFVDVHFRG